MNAGWTRRSWLRAAALCAMPVAAVRAQGCDSLKGRRLSVVVPFRAGGGYDAYARLLAPVLEELTGARVVVANIVGGTGAAGMRAVASAGAGAPALGLFDLRYAMLARLTDPAFPDPQGFQVLGSFGTTVAVWAGREDGQALLDGSGPLTFAALSGSAPRALLPGMLLQREIRLLRGFGGTGERALALLRREIDFLDGSDESVARVVASAPGTQVVLTLTSAPLPAFPGAPHLAGPGGLVDLRTRALAPAVRRERMALAAATTELASSSRTVVVSRAVPAAMRTCLQGAVDRALASPALLEAARQQKLDMEPQSGEAATRHLAAVAQLVAAHRALLERLTRAAG